MRPLVNLASDPFRNRRLFWLLILALFLIPAYLGIEAIQQKTLAEAEIDAHKAEVRNLETRLAKIEKPASGSNAVINIEKNRQLVAASDLIARRAFSWSSLLNDIERNLPPTVRVLRVGVAQVQGDEQAAAPMQTGEEDAATLSLIVIAKSINDVTTMINRFHESGRFKVRPVNNKSIEGTTDIESELRVEYIPPSPLPRATTTTAQLASAQPTKEKR